MAIIAGFSSKQSDGTYKNYTITINDECDKYGNNVVVTEQQTKEEREAKAPKKYLGNGKVIWTNGKIEVAPKKETKKDDLPF